MIKDKNSSGRKLEEMNHLIQVASNLETPQDVLVELSCSDDEFVRAAVALNKNTPRHVLGVLSKDRSSRVAGSLHKRAEVEASVLPIHPSAVIHPEAKIGSDVVIGAFTIVHANVNIGDGTVIGSHCEIGFPSHNPNDSGVLHIGENSYIRSHSIFYEGSSFGDNLLTGHRVTVREKTNAGTGFQIGTLSDIQGHCEIGDYVRFHSNVHIGQHSKIKNFVWIFPYVVLTNDPHPPSNVLMGVTVENYVAIATMSIILPGVTVGEGALVGAHSSVSRDVEPNTVVAGSPAKYVCDTSKIKLKDGSDLSAYPWRRHFHRGYPTQAVESWLAEFS